MCELILVDEHDNPRGVMEKYAAHQTGELHRAFSVFLFQGDRLLLQRRAVGKYHSAGLWANACCSHPRPGEELLAAAARRLREELGIADITLTKLFSFIYRADFPNGLSEHELDHVMLGEYSGPLSPDPGEISELRWLSPDELTADLNSRPQDFAVWFRLAAPWVTGINPNPPRPDDFYAKHCCRRLT